MAKSMPKYPIDATRTVAVDVDGVLAETPEIGMPDCFGEVIEGAQAFVDMLATGYRIVIHSSRISEGTWPEYSVAELEEFLRIWLEDNCFLFDEIHVGRGKPPAIAYVDDRGVSCRPEDDGPQAFELALEAVDFLAGTV